MKQNGFNSEYSGTDLLRNLEEGLPRYNKGVVYELFKRFSRTSQNKGFLLDFGAGTGSIATLVNDEIGIKPVCIEIDPNLIKALIEKGYEVHQELPKKSKDYRFIYSANVLEHIENDEEVLKNLYEFLPPGGQLALFLPAFNSLYSNLDSDIGHYRRYGKRELRGKLERAGFELIEIQHFDSLGFFFAYAYKVLGLLGIKVKVSVSKLKFYDSIVFPFSRFLDRAMFKHLIGKNIVAIAFKFADESM